MSTELFREWDLYDRITLANHMRHAELTAAVRAAVGRRPGPFRVLDLGCGDGWVGHQVLAASVVCEYVGVDLSAEALIRLGRRSGPGTDRIGISRQVVCGDIAATLATLPTAGFDLILAGFSLHHFTTARKAGVLDDAARVLAPGGRLAWTDTHRGDGEPRDTFVDRLADEIRTTWVEVSAAEREAVIAHIREFDHPEPLSWMAAELAARGLGPVEVLFRDPFYVAIITGR